MRIVLAGLVVVNALLSLACCFSTPAPSAPNKAGSLPSTPEGFIARFGAPDTDDSTENDQPRPIVVTRWLVYKNQDVRVFYIPTNEHKINDPVTGWQLLQFQEADTKELLSPAQVEKRMAGRDKQKPKVQESAATAKAEEKPPPPAPEVVKPERLGRDDYEHYQKLYGAAQKEGKADLPGVEAKWALYEKANVQIYFKLDAGQWNVLRFADRTRKTIDREEAELRLAPLKRKAAP